MKFLKPQALAIMAAALFVWACDQSGELSGGPMDTEDLLEQSATAQTEGDDQTVIDALTQAIKSNQLSHDSLIAAYFDRGVSYMDLGDHQKAISDFSQAIGLDGEREYIFIQRGVAYQATGDLEKALADFDRALSMDPEDTFGLYHRGQAHFSAGEMELALTDYIRVLELDPEDGLTLLARSKLFVEIGELEQARLDVEEAIALDAEDWSAYVQLGDVALAQSDFSGAVDAFNLALGFNLNSDRAMLGLCLGLSGQGDHTSALGSCKNAVEKIPSSADAVYALGKAQEADGNVPAARASYEKALALAPNNAAIVGDLARTQGE
jgi:tetratricopeptide (TPR) repeat protein